MSEERTGGGFVVVLLLAAMVALIAVPAMNDHALDSHGLDAWRAWSFMKNVTPEPQKDDTLWTGHSSENGRDYLIAKWEHSPFHGKTMWVVVIVAGGSLVTCFVCRSARYVEKIKTECD